jgi:hypothetical protein
MIAFKGILTFQNTNIVNPIQPTIIIPPIILDAFFKIGEAAVVSISNSGPSIDFRSFCLNGGKQATIHRIVWKRKNHPKPHKKAKIKPATVQRKANRNSLICDLSKLDFINWIAPTISSIPTHGVFIFRPHQTIGHQFRHCIRFISLDKIIQLNSTVFHKITRRGETS